jgi:hypothetical protein
MADRVLSKLVKNPGINEAKVAPLGALVDWAKGQKRQ